MVRRGNAVGEVGRRKARGPTTGNLASDSRLRRASPAAVSTVVKIMVDPAAPVAVRARCACYILEQTTKAMQTEDIEVRVAALSR
jgi:hypothetical protein